MRLEALQKSMMAAIDRGPDFIEPALYLGGTQAALRGLAVHANTISHARLVALEETFPRTRALLGEAAFNDHSRAFVALPAACSEPLAAIGRGFAGFLDRASPGLPAALAHFEWLWLESYHGAEAAPLRLAALAGLDEAHLLGVKVALHPAARFAGSAAVPALLGEIAALEGAAAILLTRPDAEVLVHLADPAMTQLGAMLREFQPVGNLLSACGELESERALAALLALIEAGALVQEAREPGQC